MKRKGFLIALVALMGIMLIIPLKHSLASNYKECWTKVEECGEPCPQQDSTHVEPGYEWICSCCEGTDYVYCTNYTGSKEGDTYCYAVGTHLGAPNDCSNVEIEWNPELGGTVYSQLCDTSEPD